jgi:hypothetical protein
MKPDGVVIAIFVGGLKWSMSRDDRIRSQGVLLRPGVNSSDSF